MYVLTGLRETVSEFRFIERFRTADTTQQVIHSVVSLPLCFSQTEPVSGINPNIVNSRHIPLGMNLTYAIIKQTVHENATQKFSNNSKLFPICPPSTVPEIYPHTMQIFDQ